MASASPSKSLPQLWSPKKKKKREGERRAWKLFWKLDCLAVMNRSWTMQKRWVTDSWPVMASASPLKSLPQLWSSMRRLGPPKKTKRRVWKLFWKLNCLAVMNRSWTVQKKWVTDSWPVMVSASPLKSLPQLWSGMPRLGPLKKQREECELKSIWKLDCLELCTREGVTNSRPAMVSASPLKSLAQL